jgi:tetratricopeptide (TPR) repeat protein
MELTSRLKLASDSYADTQTSEEQIRLALTENPDSLDALVGAYRFFFYKHNYEQALQIGDRLMSFLEKRSHLDESTLALRQDLDDVRLYLSCLFSTSWVLCRMEKMDEARERVERLNTLDPQDKFGGGFLKNILDRPAED